MYKVKYVIIKYFILFIKITFMWVFGSIWKNWKKQESRKNVSFPHIFKWYQITREWYSPKNYNTEGETM